MERPYTFEEIKSLAPDLINELFRILSSMKTIVEDPMSQQVSIWTYKEHCCPHCKSKRILKNGHQKSGHKNSFAKIVNVHFQCQQIL